MSNLPSTQSASTDSALTTTDSHPQLNNSNPLKSAAHSQAQQLLHSLLSHDPTTPNNTALTSAPSFLDIPPTSTLHPQDSYQHQSWKNGLGSTYQIAIKPPGASYKKDTFHWRLARTEISDSCSLSVFPGYDIHLLLLPELGANAFITAGKNGVLNPMVLKHNGEEKDVGMRVLCGYKWNGEMQTSCIVNSGPLRYLTLIANRETTDVSVSVETLCPLGQNDDGVCDDDCGNSHHTSLDQATASGLAKEFGMVPSGSSQQPTLKERKGDADASTGTLDGVDSQQHHSRKTRSKATSRILLNHYTIAYVVSGAITASTNGSESPVVVNAGQTFVVERHDDAAPTEFNMTPLLMKNQKEEEGADLTGNQDATVILFQINLKPKINRHDSLSDYPLPPSLRTNARPVHRRPSGGAVPARSGSLILYDDQPMWNLPRELESQLSLDNLGSYFALGHPSNLPLQQWDSARHYKPPVFSARYRNESEVPPPIVKDSLVIEDFPVGTISTAYINMVKQGLSEWVRIPVIVARGVKEGPTVGITAVVHGNELNGVPCIHRVITDIDVHNLSGTVVAVPCVNVPGYLNFSREFSDGKDLNRLFPGKEDGTASQIYAYLLMTKIVNNFNYLIDLHTASFGRVNSYYVRSDMNDPVSAAMAKLQQPQVILHNSGQDGTLRSAASTRGIKAITVEIGNPQLFQNQYVQWSYLGVMRILAYLNMFNSTEGMVQQGGLGGFMEGQQEQRQQQQQQQQDAQQQQQKQQEEQQQQQQQQQQQEGADRTVSIDDASTTQQLQDQQLRQQSQSHLLLPIPNGPSTILCSRGFWIYTKTGGVLEVYPAVNTIVRKGDLIARIKNIFGNIVDEIYSPSHGVTIGRSSNPVAMAGDRVLHLGVIKKENEPLAKVAKEN
ncbi:hypothetical protein HDV05_002400 [Chytridiales sp. JEL 0842]|nr:hypothetical protein HDV05_002400 [Chytridiales sp. JEL 0842]